MSTPREHINNIMDEIRELNSDHIKQANDFVMVNDLELAVHEVRKTFEQNGSLDEE